MEAGSGLLLRVPLALLGLEEAGAAGVRTGKGGVMWWEEWVGRLGFFLFFVGVGASYVRNDSNDMVGDSKGSSSSAPWDNSGESLRSRDRPSNAEDITLWDDLC